MKEDCQKAFKKLTLYFFRTQSLFIGKVIKNNRGLELVTSPSSSYEQVQKYSFFVIYYSTKFDDVMKRTFWVIPKITSVNSCKAIHDIINYSTFTCPFESEEYGKGKNYKKLEYLKNEKNFLDEIKNIFHSF